MVNPKENMMYGYHPDMEELRGKIYTIAHITVSTFRDYKVYMVKEVGGFSFGTDTLSFVVPKNIIGGHLLTEDSLDKLGKDKV